MILSNLKNSERIESLHPRFAQLFSYVKTHDLLNTPLGRIELDGDNLFINNVEAAAKAEADQPLELHRTYIDVHILLVGNERIGWKAIGQLEDCSDYDQAGDCMLSKDRATASVDIHPGEFVIVYPEDAHAPLIGEGMIRKLIAKVRL